MKGEYDFSKGERGKLLRPHTRLCVPIYLEPELQAQLERRADEEGTGIRELVTRLVKKELSPKPPVGPSPRLKDISANSTRQDLAADAVVNYDAPFVVSGARKR